MFENKTLLIESAASFDIFLREEEIEKFSLFYNLVIECNKDFNLTAITDEKDFIIKHFIDSVSAARFFPLNSSVLDIGSGAGFPSVPLAVIRKDLNITALDSTAKKMNFVDSAAKTLNLTNLKTIAGRAEEQTELFNSFDVVTARAVSSLNVLLELAFPLIKKNGIFIAYKTDFSEFSNAQSALNILGGTLLSTETFKLPNGDNRVIFIFKKIKDTPPQYPRSYGLIKKKTL